MNSHRFGFVVGGAVVLVLSGLAAAAEPQLKPCTIELVDGTNVEGRLAVQFDMPDHLIVYSPRLATVRSFLREHVDALTVDGKREELSPRRELTEEDRKLLGQIAWPDEPPAKGLRPAYTTEEWDKPGQLMVWARPGRSGRLEDPRNWLVNGSRMVEWPRPTGEHYGFVFFKKGDVDFLFPASSERYTVRPRQTNARTRHITAEAGANAEISLNVCTGNLWVSEHGSFYGGGANLGGDVLRQRPAHGDTGPRDGGGIRRLDEIGQGLRPQVGGAQG